MASSTRTTLIEMPPFQQPSALDPPKQQPISLQAVSHGSAGEPAPGTSNIVEPSQRWNNPRINTYRLAAVFYAFIIFGMNDGSYGALVPYVNLDLSSASSIITDTRLLQIESDYNLSYTVTSLVFLSPFAGYTVAALFSDRLHRYGGRRCIAVISPLSRLIAYIVISTHPPYPAVVAILAFAGLGNGLIDAAWNAWIGALAHQNQLLGLMHGCYGLGATISPLIATTIVTKGHLSWWTFYYLMAGLVALEIFAGTAAFWKETGEKYRISNVNAQGEEKGKTRQALRQKVTWICSAFLLAYVGTEGKFRSVAGVATPETNRENTLSLPRWMDSHLHDAGPPRRTLPVRHDSHRLLAWHHIGTSIARVRHS